MNYDLITCIRQVITQFTQWQLVSELFQQSESWTHLKQHTSIIQAALASSTASPSSSPPASATDADANNCTRYGKQKSCCFHRVVIMRSAMAVSSVDDKESCLQVASTGPTAIWQHMSSISRQLSIYYSHQTHGHVIICNA